jgi:hypothetical protein
MFDLTPLRCDVETLVEIFGQVKWNVGELGRYSSLLEVFGHLNKYEDYDNFKQKRLYKV